MTHGRKPEPCAALTALSSRAAVCLTAVLAGTPPAAGAPAPLEDGQTLAATHGATAEFRYVVDARSGHDYLITVEQRGLDLIVDVAAPDGTTRSYDSPLRRDDRELALIEHAAAGPYVVTVRSNEYTGAVGGHAIRLTDLTSGTDPRELEAWRLMAGGGAANFQADAEGWAAAAAAYRRAAKLWVELGRPRDQAQALYSAAAVEYWQLYEWDESATTAAAAAELYRTAGRDGLYANALHLQGAALVESALETKHSAEAPGKPTADTLFGEAFALFEQARGIQARLGNAYDLGLILNNFGYAHYNRGEFEDARKYWRQAATVMSDADEWTGELNPRGNLAGIDFEMGNVASAIDSFQRILGILPPGKSRMYRGAILDNLGISQLAFGNAESSLETFTSALEIQREIGDVEGQGRSLRGIGRTYYGLGEFDIAKTYLERALAIARQTKDGRNQEGVLRDLGNIAFLTRDYGTALDLHEQALDIVNSKSDEAYLQLLVAKDLVALGRYAEANRFATEAQGTAERSGPELLLAEALHEGGRARLHGADPKAAAAAFAGLERAASIYARLGLEGQHADVLHSLAVAERDRGRLRAAVGYAEASLTQLEDLRLRVADPELRAFYSSVRQNYYETEIGLRMALHDGPDGSDADLRTAFDTSERARARMIADLLQEASIDLRYDAEPALEKRETRLYQQLAERSRQRDKLLEAAADGSRDAGRLASLVDDIASLENALNLLEIEIREASPQFAGVSPPEPLKLPQVQALLDRDSVLLQYAFVDRSAYVWAVTRDRVVAAKLPGRETIEATARRVLGRLAAYAPTSDARAAVNADLRRLADALLEPVVAELDKKRIVLSLDGALEYIPFSVLPVRRPDGTRARLLETHEIVRVPSMSALAALRQRKEAAPPEETLAVFADPVLGADDPRLARTSAAAPAAKPAAAAARLATRSGADLKLPRLPSTAHEAEAIASLVPPAERFVAEGFAASRKTVIDTDLSRFRYIHFATHGLIDAHYPALSALALSQFDERGARRNGFLSLHDIYGLKLDADLVVLSACETALGKEVRGEGLLGLTQGFMYAGARGVIASLWPVPDRATAELMTRFYGFMLRDRLRPAAALRKAQLAIAAERRWADPYFWGSFVLIGDWR